MATLALDTTGPGAAAQRPVRAISSRDLKIVTGKFSFDASYPTGGEDISEIFNQFAECLAVFMASPTGSAGTGKIAMVDHTAKKAMLFTAVPAEVANASDQSGAANLRFIAFGY